MHNATKVQTMLFYGHCVKRSSAVYLDLRHNEGVKMPQQERFQGMSLVISDKFNWQKLTPDDGYDYFFGYYDRNPWDNTISRHLTLKVPHINRLPQVDEPAEIGFVTQDGKYTALVTTRVWCHQQGCLSFCHS